MQKLPGHSKCTPRTGAASLLHFCSILLVKTVTGPTQIQKGRGKLHLMMELHRRADAMGENVVANLWKIRSTTHATIFSDGFTVVKFGATETSQNFR